MTEKLTPERAARLLQQANYSARKAYLLGVAVMVLFTVVLILIHNEMAPLPGALVIFFGGLAVWNERLIRRLRKAGIR